MATISYLHFNHDYTGVIAADQEGFMKALLAYLTNPKQQTKDELAPFGITVLTSTTVPFPEAMGGESEKT